MNEDTEDLPREEDVGDLLREGLDRLTAGVRIPAGLAGKARAHQRRRRVALRAAVAGAATAVTAAALAAVTGGAGGAPARTGAGGVQAGTTAYVVRRVENALAGQHLVFRGRTASTGGPSITWAYGPRHRWEELTGSGCGHALPNGACSHRGGSEPYLAQGTALIGGKLTGVYVTYYNRKWSLLPESTPASACSTTGALEMGSPSVPVGHWADFINATLACGTATVSGHVRIDGVETTKITGSPVTVTLPPGEAKAVREKWARTRWILYVNPQTYLPVRIYGSVQAFGGPAGSTLFASTTDVQWLPPTAANIAQALVTIPPGFHQVSSPAGQ